MSGVGWFILACIIAFILVMVGTTMFPGVNTEVANMSTANMSFIQIAIHKATSYWYLGAIPLGIYFLFKGHSGGNSGGGE